MILSLLLLASLSFEVATIKPAPPINPVAIATTGQIPHYGTSVQGTRVDIGYESLAELITQAYDVKPSQVTGPDWLKTERFNILAKMPEGTTKEQLPEMLQTLLAERFGLKMHREMRENSIYALVVAKGGHKLKDAPPDPETPPTAGTGFNIDRSGNGATFTTPENGATKMSMTPEGRMHLEMSKMTMAAFTQVLNRMVDKPVMDMTELKGAYQVSLDLPMDSLLAVARASGVNIPLPGGRGGQGTAEAASDPSNNSSIFASVQQLGLRLEPRKESIDFIVIDHAEKTPTEN